jgi:hypothetical protein
MAKAADRKYLVTGRMIRGGAAEAAAGLTVRAFDHDRGRSPQRLAETITGGDGRFELAFTQRAAGGAGEGSVELFLTAHDEGGLLVHAGRPEALLGDSRDFGDLLARWPAQSAPGGETAGDPGASPGRAPQPTDPAGQVGDNRIHGSATRDFLVPRSPFYHGPFGRLFRQLPAWVPPGASDVEKERSIRDIADLMVEPDGPPDEPAGDNADVPAAYTYFGQFVDHDITFDPASSLAKRNDPDRLHNFRTPRFDLDNLYGEGPDDEPFMYDQRRDRRGEFLIGSAGGSREEDLPRNSQGTALIGDPRNDENLIVSQLQLAFMRFHNAVLRRVVAEEKLTGRDAFHRAQNLVRWHYQWVVLFDYLPRICGTDLAKKVIRRSVDGSRTKFEFDLRFYRFREGPFMPVEFSAAAYRLGHSQIRHRYDLNEHIRGVPIFLPPEQNPGPLADLRGFRPLPGSWSVDWRRYLHLEAGVTPQLTRRVDTRLSRALTSIPAGPDPSRGSSLATLNLLRGYRLGLPSGQAVARAMGLVPLSNERLDLKTSLAGSEAPLWFYILKEAELEQHRGQHLGPVGGRIVAETFAGLAKADPNSFFNVDPGWTPETALAGRPLIEPASGTLELADLLRVAGVAGDPFGRR